MSHATSFSLFVAKKFDETIYNLNNDSEKLTSNQRRIKSTPISIIALPSITILALAETVTCVALGVLSTAAYFLSFKSVYFLSEASAILLTRAVTSIISIPYAFSSPSERSRDNTTPPSITSSLVSGTASVIFLIFTSYILPDPAQYNKNQYREWITNTLASFKNSKGLNKHEDIICASMLELTLMREGLIGSDSHRINLISPHILSEFQNCFASAKRFCPKKNQLKERFFDINQLSSYLLDYKATAIRNNMFELSDLRNNLVSTPSLDVNHDYTPEKNSFVNPEIIIRDLENGDRLANLLTLNKDRFDIFNLIIEQPDMNAAIQQLLQEISSTGSPITIQRAHQIILEKEPSVGTSSTQKENAKPANINPPDLKSLLQIHAPSRELTRDYSTQLSTFTKTAFRNSYRHIPEFFHNLDSTNPQTGSPIISDAPLSVKKESGRDSLSSLDGHIFPKLAVYIAYLEARQGNIANSFIPEDRLASINDILKPSNLQGMRNKFTQLSPDEENIFLLKLFCSTDAESFFDKLTDRKRQTINELIKNTHDIASDFYQAARLRPGFTNYRFNNRAFKTKFMEALSEVSQEAEFA